MLGRKEVREFVVRAESHEASTKPPFQMARIGKESHLAVEAIKDEGTFVINLDSSKAPSLLDPWETLEKAEAEHAHCPRINGARWIECELADVFEVGDSFLVLGRVLHKG